ncbi:hypothetical protein GOP47_0022521 [Adiantum capillus-veneris]|uniref:rRNA-processing protein EFG1 n=1 Tax=Adiantum capillus-veneris TaxID=13818 RepID=A0A9D4U5Y0_ADICA|nr:hypothetical protein GOP47_0022521 [Adiantum capillus-veneris]
MAHGGYGKRRVAGRPPLSAHAGNSSRSLGVRHHKDSDKKAKIVSIKNQIRSVERLLRKALPLEVKDAQQRRLEDLKRQAELHSHAELERKMALRYRKVKFFERRKIERAIRRLERFQRAAADNPAEDSTRQAADMAQKLGQLKEDLEYVRFFPKTEKYVSLFTGGDDQVIVDQRNKLRDQIKANLAAAAAAGVEPEETGSEDDGAIDLSEDEFFLAGSSSDDADADDEWTDMSSRPGDERDDTSKEVASSSPRDASRSREQLRHQRLSNLGKAPAQVDAIEESQLHRQSSTRELMPPPRNRSYLSSSNSGGFESKSNPSSSRSSKMVMSESTSSQSTDQGMTGNPSSSTSWDITKATVSAVHSCNSDVQQKPRRKRPRPKKKKN